MAEIKVTSQELRKQANELKGLNRQFQKAVNDMNGYQRQLMGMWDGEAKETFNKSYQSDVKQMEEFYRTIEKYCEALEANAAEYERAEKQNVQTASKRTYR